jgi:hypothetical protein
MERTFASAVALLIAFVPVGAVAKERAAHHGEQKACAGIYRRAQVKAQAAHLREAKELLQRCARTACGTFLMQACTARYTQLDADIPSVVPVVTDAGDGAAIEVSMDGEWLTSKIDGRAVPVDPGRHEFRFAKNGDVFATEEIMILPGQRNRPISVSMHPAEAEQVRETKAAPVQRETKAALKASEESPRPAAAAKTARKRPAVDKDSEEGEAPAKQEGARSGTSAFAYIFGVTGLMGVGGYGVLTYWGRKDNRLLAGCSPNCLQSSVNHVKQLYLAADVALGVGLVALVASTYLFASSGSETASNDAVSFRINPTPTGAMATIGGAF